MSDSDDAIAPQAEGAGLTAPSSPEGAPVRRRPFEGLGGAVWSGLGRAGRSSLRHGRVAFDRARSKAQQAARDFQRHRKHVRYRVYALASYGLLCAATAAAQLYQPNALRAYVRVEQVEMPAVTNIFLRNDSDRDWTDVKLTLNGIYSYERPRLSPGDHILLRIDRFALYDKVSGRPSFAPRSTVARKLALDCDRGHFETELLK